MSRPRYVTPRERKLAEEQRREVHEEQRQDGEPKPVDRVRPAPRRMSPLNRRMRTPSADREEPAPRWETTDDDEPSEDGDEAWDEDGDGEEDWAYEYDSGAEEERRSGWPTPTPVGGPPSGRSRHRDDWLELVLASIPVEIITAWAVIETILESNAASITPRGFWAIFVVVLFATVFHTLRGFHEDADGTEVPPPERSGESGRRATERRRLARWTMVVQVALAVSSFVVWAYYLAGPFQVAGLYNPTYAAVILPLYTLFGPQLLPILPPYLADFESWVRQRTEGTQATEGTGA